MVFDWSLNSCLKIQSLNSLKWLQRALKEDSKTIARATLAAMQFNTSPHLPIDKATDLSERVVSNLFYWMYPPNADIQQISYAAALGSKRPPGQPTKKSASMARIKSLLDILSVCSNGRYFFVLHGDVNVQFHCVGGNNIECRVRLLDRRFIHEFTQLGTQKIIIKILSEYFFYYRTDF